jgi:hypothetical protein
MRWLFILLKSVLSPRSRGTERTDLLGMYFGESNHSGRRHPNRDRA